MSETRENELARWTYRWKAAVLTGLILGLANHVLDFVPDRVGISAWKTILNDVVIGLLGFLAVFFYLSASYAKQNFANARERMILIGELNVRIRQALVGLASAAMSEDRGIRLQGIDEAEDRIDGILCDCAERRRLVNAQHSHLPS